MFKITFTLNGIQKVSRTLLKTLPDEAVKNLAASAGRSAKLAQLVGQHAAPRKTGKLVNDLIVKTSARGLVRRIGVYAAERGYIARFLTFGVQAHAVRGGADVSRGKRQTGRMHPGFPPKDFLLGPTLGMRNQFQEDFRLAMIEALRTAAAEYNGGMIVDPSGVRSGLSSIFNK